MAGASMNDIKARIKSVESTMQITKAMELVATSKLRRARERVEASRPFCTMLGKMIDTVKGVAPLAETGWFSANEGKTLFIMIAGDRGLAGGYNSNVFRLTEMLAGGKEAIYLPIGKKATEYLRHRGRELLLDYDILAGDVRVGTAHRLSRSVCDGYLEGKFTRVVLVYTKFQSMMTQLPVYEELLPLGGESTSDAAGDPIFEEEPEEMLERIVRHYVSGVIYSAVCESLASESGARRSAMNAANKNAGEMIDTLMLKFNRARQAVITQEITEIVSGAEAL
ncbi:MAG: ATP synthase F1 subunit gamma [Clostridia bacterium]|nr:ATP synthase F1 subunit gamma [Clostridia bacterium]